MSEPTTDHVHGTPGGYTAHVKNGTPPCDPCTTAAVSYQAAYKIRTGAVVSLKIRVSDLKRLLDGEDPVEVLTQLRGAEVVAAIRQSGGAE